MKIRLRRSFALGALLTAMLAAAACPLTATKPGPAVEGRDAELLAAARDVEIVKVGKEIYAGLCKACHGEEGVQVDAPSNLFDANWHHGSKPSEIEGVVLRGILEKGMPAWGEVLPAEDIAATVAYLLSLQPTARSGAE